MVHVARPGPDVYPFIVTQGALHWIEDMSLFLNRDFQFFVDTIITVYAVLDAWARGRTPIPATSAQADALIARIVDADAQLKNRGGDVFAPGIGIVNEVTMCMGIIMSTFMCVDGRKYPVFEGGSSGPSVGRDLI